MVSGLPESSRVQAFIAGIADQQEPAVEPVAPRTPSVAFKMRQAVSGGG